MVPPSSWGGSIAACVPDHGSILESVQVITNTIPVSVSPQRVTRYAYLLINMPLPIHPLVPPRPTPRRQRVTSQCLPAHQYATFIRGIIPPIFGLDLSPILAFVTLNLLTSSTATLAAEIPQEGEMRERMLSLQKTKTGKLAATRGWMKQRTFL